MSLHTELGKHIIILECKFMAQGSSAPFVAGQRRRRRCYSMVCRHLEMSQRLQKCMKDGLRVEVRAACLPRQGPYGVRPRWWA